MNQIPEIKEETEFQKLAQEYGIVMEGEKCMGRKIRTGALLILVLAMIYTQQAVIYAQNEAEKNMKKTTESENSAGTNGEDKEQEKPGGEEGIKTRNRSSPRLRDMSWKSPRLMEKMDIIYQSRPL